MARPDVGSLRDPMPRLQEHWRADRERMKRSVPPAARAEYQRLTELGREECQREKAWSDPDAARLYKALSHHTVRASEAGRVVRVWLAVPAFGGDVDAFERGEISAEALLRRADTVRRERRARRP